MGRIMIAAAGWVALAGAAAAQIQPLAPTSRGEAASSGINNSLAIQQQNRAAAQQNQFEINSLRNEQSRPVAPPVVAPISPVGPPGQIVR